MVKLQDFENAARRIRSIVLRTPLVSSPTLSQCFDCEIHLKLENLQRTGSFKIRGAAHKILKNIQQIEKKGLVAASAGNHAQGVALAGRIAGIAATIVMPEWSSISKQEATRSYGGEVMLFGKTVDESLQKARMLSTEGRTFVHPFDDLDIILGQGTIALEIFEDLRDADSLIIPIGGGGLISGVACAAKAIRPDIRIIGVQARTCPSAHAARQKGMAVSVAAGRSIADGITVKQTGEIPFQFIRKFVDDIVLVEEEHIASAILMLLERKKILAEGAGAVPLAALLGGAVRPAPGEKAVLIVSGGNVDSPLLGRIIQKGLLRNGRLLKVRLDLNDVPGSLSKLLEKIARLEANVLHIYHDRDVRELPVHMTHVVLELETRGPAHIEEIKSALWEAGHEACYDCFV